MRKSWETGQIVGCDFWGLSNSCIVSAAGHKTVAFHCTKVQLNFLIKVYGRLDNRINCKLAIY